MDHGPPSHPSLYSQLRAGKDWTRFCDLYVPFIQEYLRRTFGVNPNEVADVTSEVLLRLVKGIGTYDPARGRFRPWLKRIARNAFMDWLEDRKRQRRAEDAVLEKLHSRVADDFAEELARHDERLEAFDRLRLRVSDEQYAAFCMKHLENLDTQEITAALRITPTNLYQLLRRVKMELKEIVREMSED
jgi:RNA polymerase sigma-70 factor (ECF subfamily)